MSETMKPELFEIATDKGPEFVAAYAIGDLRVHLRVEGRGYAITHAATGMCAIPYGINKREVAFEVAKVIDDAADWSALKLAEYGKPEWGNKKEEYMKAAKAGMDMAGELDAICID